MVPIKKIEDLISKHALLETELSTGKVDKKLCKPAIKYWKEHHEFWANVRSIWDGHYNSVNTLSLKSKLDDKSLYMYFFDHPTEGVNKLIDNFIIK